MYGKKIRIATIEASKEEFIAAATHNKRRSGYRLKCDLARECPYSPLNRHYAGEEDCHTGRKMPLSFTKFGNNLPACAAAKGLKESEKNGFEFSGEERWKQKCFYNMKVLF